MTHRFKLGHWLVRPDLLEIESSTMVHQLDQESMRMLLSLSAQEGQPVHLTNLTQSCSNDHSEEVLSSLIQIVNGVPGRQKIIESCGGHLYRVAVPALPVLTNSPEPQPKWQQEGLAGKGKQSFTIWPMALITAAALLLGMVWMGGGFLVNGLNRISPLAQPITNLPGRESDAAISPDGRYLAFSWAPNENSDVHLYLKDFETDDIRQLTYHPGRDFSPAWSPDGSQVAFLRESLNQLHLQRLDLDGGQVSPLHVLSTKQSYGLSWSPDGQRLAFSDRIDPNFPPAIVTVDLSSGNLNTVSNPPGTSQGDHFPRFSPNGDRLAFIREIDAKRAKIFTASLDGSEQEPILSLGSPLKGVTWLSDNELLFTSNRQGSSALMRVNTEEKKATPISGIHSNATMPSLSPGGRFLTFETLHHNSDILTFELDEPSWPKLSPLRTVVASSHWDATPQFSPDGTQLAFTSDRNGHSQIWISGHHSTQSQPLTGSAFSLANAPRWSPDGKTIAFEAKRFDDANLQIYTISLENREIRKISDGRAEDRLPTWSACGDQLYFHSRRNRQPRIWRMPVAGGQARPVTKYNSMLGFEDRQGGFFYYVNHQENNRIWRIDLATGKETQASQTPVSHWGNWALAAHGFYFIQAKPDGQAQLQFQEWDQTTPKTIRVLPFVPENLGFAMAMGQSRVAVVQQQPPEGDIMLLPLH